MDKRSSWRPIPSSSTARGTLSPQPLGNAGGSFTAEIQGPSEVGPRLSLKVRQQVGSDNSRRHRKTRSNLSGQVVWASGIWKRMLWPLKHLIWARGPPPASLQQLLVASEDSGPSRLCHIEFKGKADFGFEFYLI